MRSAEITSIRPRYDAIIVGSGAGGSTLAYQLTKHGLRVLVVERGDFLKPQRKTGSEPIGRYLYDVVKPETPLTFVGGATKFYGSALYRLRESDFRATTHEAGVSPAWPIGYADLEPYYGRAEGLYHVHGAVEGDPSEPPRSTVYPHPPLPHDPLVAKVVKRLAATGTAIAPIPRGVDYGPGGTCELCATCDGYYCQIDAKMDAEKAALRPAMRTGNVDILTGAECLKVLTDASGEHAIGATIRQNGMEKDVPADVVAVCAGIPGSAHLLRRSRNAPHPEGLGNNSGMLGRYLGGHSVGMLFPIVSPRPLGPRHTKTFAINAAYEGVSDWHFPMGVIQVAGQMPYWQNAPWWMRLPVKVIVSHALTCFYMTEALPTAESGYSFAGDTIVSRQEPQHNAETFARMRSFAVKAFRRAGFPVIARPRHYFWHDVGTARFGHDPADSVTNPDCMVHGISGLYVIDACVLPSAGAVNTALTIMALALRAGDRIAGKIAS
jgi:choline dehydrogenase-like flavoprotein